MCLQTNDCILTHIKQEDKWSKQTTRSVNVLIFGVKYQN